MTKSSNVTPFPSGGLTGGAPPKSLSSPYRLEAVAARQKLKHDLQGLSPQEAIAFCEAKIKELTAKIASLSANGGHLANATEIAAINRELNPIKQQYRRSLKAYGEEGGVRTAAQMKFLKQGQLPEGNDSSVLGITGLENLSSLTGLQNAGLPGQVMVRGQDGQFYELEHRTGPDGTTIVMMKPVGRGPEGAAKPDIHPEELNHHQSNIRVAALIGYSERMLLEIDDNIQTLEQSLQSIIQQISQKQDELNQLQSQLRRNRKAIANLQAQIDSLTTEGNRVATQSSRYEGLSQEYQAIIKKLLPSFELKEDYPNPQGGTSTYKYNLDEYKALAAKDPRFGGIKPREATRLLQEILPGSKFPNHSELSIFGSVPSTVASFGTSTKPLSSTSAVSAGAGLFGVVGLFNAVYNWLLTPLRSPVTVRSPIVP